MLYMLPIFIIARYYPKNKGKVTGIILGAYGLGALSSGYIVMFFRFYVKINVRIYLNIDK